MLAADARLRLDDGPHRPCNRGAHFHIAGTAHSLGEVTERVQDFGGAWVLFGSRLHDERVRADSIPPPLYPGLGQIYLRLCPNGDGQEKTKNQRH
jgi:hypothetical protein